MQRNRLIKATLAAFLATAITGGCAVGPVMPSYLFTYDRQWPVDYAGQHGDADWQGRFGGACEDEELQAYVQQVGQRIAAQTGTRRRVDFVVLRGWSPNAFVLAGTKVCITTGLIYKLECEGELAAALGHEIGHVAAGHTTHRPTHQDEYEADSLALRYIARAGYDPANMVTLLEKLERDFDGGQEGITSGLAGQHPRTRSRIRRLQFILDSEYLYKRRPGTGDAGGRFRVMHDRLDQQGSLAP